MLPEEAKLIYKMLKNERNKIIINVCSSNTKLWKINQPYILTELINPLAETNNKIVNLDIKDSEGVDIVCDCTNMYKVKSRSYDIALFTSGVEHIIEVDKALLEIKRILRKDGFMICSAPGVYPKHNDPIDTMLRLPKKEDWLNLLRKGWIINKFIKTKPIPAKPVYKYDKLVFATIIKAYPKY